MSSTLPRVATLALVATIIAVACSKENKESADEKPKVEYIAFGEWIQPEDSLPRVRYFENGQVSLNDRCAVRKVRLNPKFPPVYVNGHPVGFC